MNPQRVDAFQVWFLSVQLYYKDLCWFQLRTYIRSLCPTSKCHKHLLFARNAFQAAFLPIPYRRLEVSQLVLQWNATRPDLRWLRSFNCMHRYVSWLFHCTSRYLHLLGGFTSQQQNQRISIFWQQAGKLLVQAHYPQFEPSSYIMWDKARSPIEYRKVEGEKVKIGDKEEGRNWSHKV